jgi:hypothetical protein
VTDRSTHQFWLVFGVTLFALAIAVAAVGGLYGYTRFENHRWCQIAKDEITSPGATTTRGKILENDWRSMYTQLGC